MIYFDSEPSSIKEMEKIRKDDELDKKLDRLLLKAKPENLDEETFWHFLLLIMMALYKQRR